MISTHSIDNKTKFKEIQSKNYQNESKFITFQNCISKSDIFETFELLNPSISNEDILLLKFQTTDNFPDLSSTDLHQLNKIFKHTSAVIIFESENHESISIFWKLNEIEEFLLLKINEKLDIEKDRKLQQYVADFIVKSIKNNHLGKL